ncbi:MAG: cation transporter [Proteobacteria bacterium]|nr:cation transporter [Pseudomonadota bacterium]
MKTVLTAVVFAASLLASASVFAVEQTVTLNVKGMTCASCPYIVKQTLAQVDGVKDVDVSFRKKMATVTYDDQICSAAKLARAVTEMGFPTIPATR